MTFAEQTCEESIPEVSVVMSVYNDARYLQQAIDSILAQESVILEFVIVDDGSTDNSPEILSEYAAKDKRIRIIRQENTGLTKALIRGCKEARAEFIARQDADDVSMPNRLKRQLEILRNREDVGLVSCSTARILEAGETLDIITPTADAQTISQRLYDDDCGVPCHGSVVFRKRTYDTVGGYRNQFYFAQDADLWSRIIEVARYECLTDVLYHLRWRPDSISSSRGNTQREFHRIGRQCREARRKRQSEDLHLAEAEELREGALLVSKSKSKDAQHNTANFHYMLGKTLLDLGQLNGRRHLWRSLMYSPLQPRAIFFVLISYLPFWKPLLKWLSRN